MPCCSMWLLLLLCVSTVAGVPVHPPPAAADAHDEYDAAAAAAATGNVTVSPTLHVQPPNTSQPLTVGALPLNNAHNATHPTPKFESVGGGRVSITLRPPRRDDAETLEELVDDLIVQEGDILMPEVRNALHSLWQDAIVPYVISRELGNVTVSPTLHVPQPNTSQPLTVGALPLNNAHNATHPTPKFESVGGGRDSITLRPPRRDDAETLEELEDDLIVQEGDILMPEVRNALNSLWLDAIVPYIISRELADRWPDMDAAFSMISQVTCIRFKKHTNEFNYLNIKQRKGCASYVGCQGGAQSLFYGPRCGVGNLCHELLHALGLYHEHTRDDRDQYVSVQWPSIQPGRKHGFKMKHGDTQNLPYDVDSIMHYGLYFFSQNGGPTLLPNEGGQQMGQRTHLSQLDIQRINSLYHCDERMNPQ